MSAPRIPIGFFILDMLGVALLGSGIYGLVADASQIGLPWLNQQVLAITLVVLGGGLLAVAALHLVSSIRFQQSLQGKRETRS